MNLKTLEQACKVGSDKAVEDASDTTLQQKTRDNQMQASMTLAYLAYGLAKVKDEQEKRQREETEQDNHPGYGYSAPNPLSLDYDLAVGEQEAEISCPKCQTTFVPVWKQDREEQMFPTAVCPNEDCKHETGKRETLPPPREEGK